LSHTSKKLLGRIRKLANHPGFIIGVQSEGGYDTYLVDWEGDIDDLIQMLENGDDDDRLLACAWIGAKIGMEDLQPPKRIGRYGIMVTDITTTAHFKPNI
jgi:hypothetical protein